MGKGEGEGMATTWNHYLEDRLVKLERRQERLAHRLHELSEIPVAGAVPDAAPMELPPVDPTVANPASLPTDLPPGTVTTAHAVTVSAAPSAGASHRLPPLTGGQGAQAGGLGIWRPGQARSSTSGRDRRRNLVGALQKAHQTSLGLRQGLMRVETMIGLAGQLVQLASGSGAVSGQPASAQLSGYGGQNALVGAPVGHGALAPVGHNPLAGNAGGPGGLGALGALLGALGGANGGVLGGGTASTPDVTALASPTPVAGYAAQAMEPEPNPGGGEITFRPGAGEMEKLQALMPLLQQLGTSRGGLPAKLASVVSSPAFQQLLSGLKS